MYLCYQRESWCRKQNEWCSIIFLISSSSLSCICVTKNNLGAVITTKVVLSSSYHHPRCIRVTNKNIGASSSSYTKKKTCSVSISISIWICRTPTEDLSRHDIHAKDFIWIPKIQSTRTVKYWMVHQNEFAISTTKIRFILKYWIIYQYTNLPDPY